MLALSATKDDRTSYIVICHLPSMSSSAPVSSPVSVTMLIPLADASDVSTIAEILPASFLTLGHPVDDPDGILFISDCSEPSLAYRLIDYSPSLPNAEQLKFPVPVASYISLTINVDAFDQCVVDKYVVGTQCLQEEGGKSRVMGSVEYIQPANVGASLETPLLVQLARIHGDRAPESLKMDVWRGCVYLTLKDDGQVIHVYDFVEPVV